jgi:signal transduction histidine kinase
MTLRLLHVEDCEEQTLPVLVALERAGHAVDLHRVDCLPAMRAALERDEWDLVLCDYVMPEFSAIEALKLLQESGRDIPFIIVSGLVEEPTAMAMMRAGAQDFIPKDHMGRLAPAVERELRQAQNRRDRANLEVQLRHSQKLESIGQLAAGIAHEINTPTQYIGDNLRFVQEAFRTLAVVLEQHPPADWEYLNAEIPKALAQSLDGVERVSNIVLAMKEFSHPSAGEKTAVDIPRAIESTLTVARNEWKYVAEVVTEFDPDLPPVRCLPCELNQVILNLIVNAAHAIGDVVGTNGDRKGQITIRTRRQDKWAEIQISDTGTGIPARIKDRIFDPFFTTKPVGKGTGQGLAIAHSVIVDKHGGTIAVDTAEGRGTTFIVRLPMI